MSATGENALVCGFADPGGAVGGCWWRLRGGTGALMLAGDAVSGGEAEQLEQPGGARARLSADSATCEVSLSPRPGSVELEGADGAASPLGPLTAAICEAAVEFEYGGRRRTLACGGYTCSWAADPPNADAFRHLVVPLGEDSLVILAARRPGEAEGHGQEDVACWRLEAEGGAAPFAEALLSTQYDAAGDQTRAGLELWPEGDEAPPTRAAGTTIGHAAAGAVTAALLRTSAEGAEGIGTYLIWRP
jgi:hypothetical protein